MNTTISNRFIRCVILICCMMSVASYSKAHTDFSADKDTVKVKKGDKGTSDKQRYVAGNYGFNALDYIMQGRYRHGDNVEYSNNDFWSHFYAGASFGMDMLASRYDFKYDPGTTWGLLVGKELNKTHSLSLLFLYGQSHYKIEPVKAVFNRYSLQLNHHFNFTRYYLGYNPYRKLELLSTLGVGMQHGSIWDNDQTVPYFSVGLQAAFRMGNNVRLVLEPYMNIGGEGYNGAEKGYWYSKYNVSYGARAAVNYTFKNELTGSDDSEEMLFPDYFFIGYGLQSLNSDMDFMKTLGPSLTLGYGKWLSPRFGVQLSAGWSAGGWFFYNTSGNASQSIPRYTRYVKSQYLYGRLEGMFNLFSTFRQAADASKGLSLNLLAGYEFGRLWKYQKTVDDQYNDNYGGLTAGLRLKYHGVEGKALYIEPRVTFATYGKPYGGKYKDTDMRRLDSRYSLAFGMEYGSPNFNGDGYRVEDEYKPRMSLFVAGGPNYMFNRQAYDGATNVCGSYALGFEYQFHKLFGARIMADYSTYAFNSLSGTKVASPDGDVIYRSALWNKKYSLISGILDFKLDLTSLFYGYNASRRWNTALYIGPIISKHESMSADLDDSENMASDVTKTLTGKEPGGTSIGLHTAFNAQYNITKEWGLFGEMDLRLYDNDIITDYSIDYNPVRALAFRLGASYSFDAETVLNGDLTGGDRATLPMSPNYFFLSTGLRGIDVENIALSRTLGPSLTLGYGHWFSQRLGYQLSAGWSAGAWKKSASTISASNLYSKLQVASVRAEAMVGLFSTPIGYQGRGFSTALLGGIEAGYMWKYRKTLDDQSSFGYAGPTVGLRLKYHSVEGKVIYLEPRMTHYNYKDEYDGKCTETSYSLALGMEYGTPYLNGAGRPEIEDEFTSKIAVSVMGGPNYMFNRQTYDGATNICGSYALGLEYQFHKLYGARIMADYSTYAFNSLSGTKIASPDGDVIYRSALWNKKYSLISGILDFKLDLSNLFYGYQTSRRWNTAFYIGPIISKHSSLSADIGNSELFVSGEKVELTGEEPDGTSIGLHTAFNAKYSINEHWSVFGETDLRLYDNDIITDYSIDYNPVRALGVRLGLSYNIK